MKTLGGKTLPCALILMLGLVFSAGHALAGDSKNSGKNVLVKAWQTEKVFSVPESVLYHKADKTLYVSNINGAPTEKNGKGFISKLSLEGRVLKLRWAEGLNAPKGAAIFGNSFFVSDIDRLVEIDMKTGKIRRAYPDRKSVG